MSRGRWLLIGSVALVVALVLVLGAAADPQVAYAQDPTPTPEVAGVERLPATGGSLAPLALAAAVVAGGAGLWLAGRRLASR